VDGVDGLELGLASFEVDVARTQFETTVLPAHSHIHRNKRYYYNEPLRERDCGEKDHDYNGWSGGCTLTYAL
jgi:hypothetical protein